MSFAIVIELFGTHGPSLFALPPVPKAPGPVFEALQQYHQSSVNDSNPRTGAVRVRGERAVRIPGGVLKLVASTCPEQASGQAALFEPSDSGLPGGLLASSCLVRGARGTAYIPVVNVGMADVLLYPRTCLGSLCGAQVISLSRGVTEVKPTIARVSAQEIPSVAQDGLASIDLATLPEENRREVGSLLQRYSSVFSTHDGDLGCTNLISHNMPLLDDAPVRQRYRRVPPSEYEEVKSHINQLLEAKVIRESCSPYASPIVLVRKKNGSLRLCV